MIENPTIKPIPTKYKGYLFRSRLEARWAMFLDTLRVIWQYEQEGYLPNCGQLYLPDFWMPHGKCFLEIKPGPGIDFDTMHKAEPLATESGHPVIILAGTARFEHNEAQ